MGFRPSDFLGMLGGVLAMAPLGRGPVSRGIGPVVNALAQVSENIDQQERIQQLGQNLDAQYGGLDMPELKFARMLINQGDVPGGMQMLTEGISARNRQQRADRRAQQQETATIAGVNTLKSVTEPGITSLEPMTQAQRLAPPTRSSRATGRTSTARRPWRRSWHGWRRSRTPRCGGSPRRASRSRGESTPRRRRGRRPTRTSRIRSTTWGVAANPSTPI
jgi:hypothetical protein